MSSKKEQDLKHNAFCPNFKNEFTFVKYNVALDIQAYMQHDNMRMPMWGEER